MSCETSIVQVSRSVPSSLEVQCSKTPQQKRKQRLCLLERTVTAVHLSPQKSKLYRTARLLKRRQTHSQKKLSTLKARLREAEKFYKSTSLHEMTHNLSPTQEAFLHMQLKTSKYATQGR